MNIVVIGNGITGVTAAREIRKRTNHRITIISSESKYFFSRTALMYVYMGHMKFSDTQPYEDWFWKKNKIDLVFDHAVGIDIEQKRVLTAGGNSFSYDKLILATGSKPNRFGWKGQHLAGVQGLYSRQDLDLLEQNTRNISSAVIVGGGLIGIELAEMLMSRNIEVKFLVREKSFWDTVLPAQESAMVTRHILEHGVDLLLEQELSEITDDGSGRVKSIITKDGREIECGLVGLTTGVSPNIDIAKDTEINTLRGIIVNEYLETNLPDIYAAGDCAEFTDALPYRKKIEQVWYTGKIQAETLAKTVCGLRTVYSPGMWFNSAKFFDIEYQTYGLVNFNTDGEKNLYWEHKSGKKSIRIVYNDNRVIGFNLMGVRFRHEVCEKWITANQGIEYVLQNLREANFDPEFYENFEEELISIYNAQTGKNLKLNRRSGFVNYMKKYIS